MTIRIPGGSGEPEANGDLQYHPRDVAQEYIDRKNDAAMANTNLHAFVKVCKKYGAIQWRLIPLRPNKFFAWLSTSPASRETSRGERPRC
jgi:hypothetical protein